MRKIVSHITYFPVSGQVHQQEVCLGSPLNSERMGQSQRKKDGFHGPRAGGKSGIKGDVSKVREREK